MTQSLNNSALEEAKTLFTKEGLSFPYIPEEMIPQVKKLHSWIFGTREDTPSPYQIAKFVEEIDTKPVENYLIFGHAGYGTNSWAMHYFLVKDNLALFTQTSWGGIYTDNETAIKTMTDRFIKAEKLSKIFATKKALLTAEKLLIVVISDFYGSGWTFKESLLDRQNNWNETWKALEEAIAFAESL
jgi:hypothetical protein